MDDRALKNLNGAAIELTAEGGIAALSVHHIAHGQDRSFAFAQRHICDKQCGAPLDSASGILTNAANDSLFATALSKALLLDKEDYGTTQGGADMMTYVLKVSSGGITRTARADDGTMPEPMRAIVQSLRETISAARK